MQTKEIFNTFSILQRAALFVHNDNFIPGAREQVYLGGLEMSVTCASDTGHEGDMAGRKTRRGLSGAYAVNKLWRA